MPETMKLLGSSKSKITKNKNGKNVLHLEITDAVLVHSNIVINGSKSLDAYVPNKSFSQLLDISPKSFYIFIFLFQRFHILRYGLLINILN